MLHPNLLGPYLLLATPPLLSCGLAVSPLPFKPLWLGAGAAGLLGIACTLSRSPWVVALAEGALLMAGLLVLRRIGVQRVVGLATLSAIVLGLALLPFKDRILRRLTSNLTDSFEERGRLNRIALLSAAEHPFVGVGLNNQSLPILRHAPQHRGALEFAYEAKGKKVRMMVSIHNFFLMLLVETGLVGLGAFLVFVGSRLGAAVRALPGLTGAWQAACLGLIVGLVGLLAQMWGDFSLWMDPSFYTVALFIAMLHVAPSLAHAQPEAFERRWNDWRRRR
jgi:O-antigen ligase